MAQVLSLGLLLAVLAAPAQAESPSRLLPGGGGLFLAGGNGAPAGEVICLRGRLTEEGIECPALRGEDGALYTLAGDMGGFEAGDEVCVCGTAAAVSFCMQGTTIAVTHLSSGQQGCPPQAP